MDIRIVIFLAFTSATFVINTVIMWFAYRSIASMVAKVTETVTPLSKSQATAEWLQSLHTVSTRVLRITEEGKQKMAECGPTLDKAQSWYGYGLAKVDVKLARVEEGVARTGNKIQSKVERSSFAVAGFAAGIRTVAATMLPETEEEPETN